MELLAKLDFIYKSNSKNNMISISLFNNDNLKIKLLTKFIIFKQKFFSINILITCFSKFFLNFIENSSLKNKLFIL